MSETYIDVPVDEIKNGDEVRTSGIGVYIPPTGPTHPVDLSGNCWERVVVADPASIYFSIKDGDGASRFRRTSIVAARRRVEVVPPVERFCACGNLPENERYALGKPCDRNHSRHVCAESSCTRIVECGKKCDAHTPKELKPVREPGCGREAKPNPVGWWCSYHEDGHHVAHDGNKVCDRWPIEAPKPPKPPEPEPKVEPGTWKCVGAHGCKLPFNHAEKDFTHRYTCRVYRSTGLWSPDTREGKPRILGIGDPVEIGFSAYVEAWLPPQPQLAMRIAGESYEAYYKRIGLDVRPTERRKGGR